MLPDRQRPGQSNAPRIALVSCGKAKLDCPAPAGELYTSNLFRLSAAWAEAFCDGWFVVSAQHGLVEPGRVIAPYESSLAEMRTREREAWCFRVLGALAPRGPLSVVLLAGGHYRELAALVRWSWGPGVNFHRGVFVDVEEPLEGLGIGERLGWLKRELEAVPA
jgi:hypothetical protein